MFSFHTERFRQMRLSSSTGLMIEFIYHKSRGSVVEIVQDKHSTTNQNIYFGYILYHYCSQRKNILFTPLSAVNQLIARVVMVSKKRLQVDLQDGGGGGALKRWGSAVALALLPTPPSLQKPLHSSHLAFNYLFDSAVINIKTQFIIISIQAAIAVLIQNEFGTLWSFFLQQRFKYENQ